MKNSAEDRWNDWVGRRRVQTDRVTETSARALAATLNREDLASLKPGDELPAIWTWLSFLQLATQTSLGPDGHPRRGDFLPPVPLARRMWAGSRCAFHAPVRVGDNLEKTSTILKVVEKTGGAGEMVFVTVRHVIAREGEPLTDEEQDLVFLAIPDRFSPPAPTPAPPGDWTEAVAVDPVLLFRFSALTFNGHRIHYDRAYATDVERYPGLVVHGPLQATLLFDAASRHAPDRTPAAFAFRGLRPLFDFDAVTLIGRSRGDDGLDLFTANGDGAVGMQATLDWRPR